MDKLPSLLMRIPDKTFSEIENAPDKRAAVGRAASELVQTLRDEYLDNAANTIDSFELLRAMVRELEGPNRPASWPALTFPEPRMGLNYDPKTLHTRARDSRKPCEEAASSLRETLLGEDWTVIEPIQETRRYAIETNKIERKSIGH